MKKLKSILYATVVFLLLLTMMACAVDSGKKASKPLNGEEIQTKALQIATKDSMECSMISSNGTDLFYVLAELIPQSNFEKKAQIVKADPDTKKNEVIYETEDAEGFYLSELQASDDFIVWENVTGKGLLVNKMDLKTGEIETIYTSDSPDVPVLLSVYDNDIFWYDMNGPQLILNIYDSTTKELTKISGIEINTPYERIETNDGRIAYLSSEDCGEGKQKVIVYDLDTKSEVKDIVIEEDLPIQRLSADRQYVTYMLADKEDANYSLYAYDCEKDETIRLNEKDGMYIFSYRLVNGKALINEKSENDVISLDIASGEKQNLTEKIEGEHAFYLDGSYKDTYFVLNDGEKPEIVYFDVSNE